jgi:DNA-3-methyladenine glycosylase
LRNKYKKLPKIFYTRGAVTVAKELIGKLLVFNNDRKLLSGIIVETEAYTGKNDPASHSFIGKTKRNEVMFDEGGKVYIYFTYGNHYCMNVVTGKKNQGNAVLIRAIQPVHGLEYMYINRDIDDLYNLTNGPGKLTQALGIDKSYNGEDFSGNVIFIAESDKKIEMKIARSKRIGITKNKEKLYRFYAKDNPFVSRINISKLVNNDKGKRFN